MLVMDNASDISHESSVTETNNSAVVPPRAAKDTKDFSKGKVPYILNGALYEVLAQEGENVTVKCCNCPADRVYRGSVRSTGNFHMHIKRRHPELLAQLNEMKINALLDRRERMGKTRKLRTTKSLKQKSATKIKTKSDDKPLPQSPIVNLKIKTVFQRHQQQAQQHREETLKNWYDENENFATPATEASEPLDLSTNTAEEKVEMHAPDLPKSAENIKAVMPTAHAAEKNQSPKFESKIGAPVLNESQTQVMQDQRTEDDIIFCNDCNVQPQPLPFIKQEPLLLDEPMDLSFKSGHRPSTFTPSTDVSAGRDSAIPSSFENAVMQLNDILIDVQREMLVRNQIELNRIVFDVAKFKYIYPNFSYP